MPRKDIHLPSGYLKADMHCHSHYSGLTAHMTAFEPMDCYSTPQQVYELAKHRGMDLVTITDHDSIDGCLAFLNNHPDASDFFVGEEVTVKVQEFKKEVHVAVYDITEEQHREISRLKSNFDETIAYLQSNKILHALNHLFHDFPPSQTGTAFLKKMFSSFDVMEGINGALDEGHNLITQRITELFPGKTMIAGSDSHTLLRLGSCFTACPAQSKTEFLQQIREGNTMIAGSYGRFHHKFNDAVGVYLNYFRDLVFRRNVHVHWPLWKEVRNALGWIVCLPVYCSGAFSVLAARHWIEKFRQRDYELFIAEVRSSFS